MNPSPNMSGLSNGRPNLFTEEKALEILETRKQAGGDPVQVFLELLIGEGILTKEKTCSVGTMQRLLTGKMFPDLVDPKTGAKYDYSVVPRAQIGYRPPPLDAHGDPISRTHRPMSVDRQRFFDLLMTEVKRYVRHNQAAQHSGMLQDRDRRIEEQRLEIEALKLRVTKLEPLPFKPCH